MSANDSCFSASCVSAAWNHQPASSVGGDNSVFFLMRICPSLGLTRYSSENCIKCWPFGGVWSKGGFAGVLCPGAHIGRRQVRRDSAVVHHGLILSHGLVGGLEHEFYFPLPSWECHHPIWRTKPSFFQGGRSTTNQLICHGDPSDPWLGIGGTPMTTPPWTSTFPRPKRRTQGVAMGPGRVDNGRVFFNDRNPSTALKR
jgi:hypothetical protein